MNTDGSSVIFASAPEAVVSQPGTGAGWLQHPVLPRRNVIPRKRKLFSRSRLPQLSPRAPWIQLPSFLISPHPLPSPLILQYVQACPRSSYCRGFQSRDCELLPVSNRPVFCFMSTNSASIGSRSRPLVWLSSRSETCLFTSTCLRVF